MLVQQITTIEELAGLESAWNQLDSEVPFRTWDWQEAWWRVYGGHATSRPNLCVLTVCDDTNEVTAILPLYSHDSAWSGRTLRFLGTGEVCSEYLGLLCKPGARCQAAEVLADWLTRPGTDPWELMELAAIDAADESVGPLVTALAARGSTIDRRPGPSCWRIDLPKSWDEYVRRLSRSHRKQLRRIERRMIETGRAHLRTVTNEAELSIGLDLLVQLHQQRHRSLGRSGCFHSPQFSQFHFEAAKRMMQIGMLRLHWLELDGKPVAVEYQLAGKHGLFAYQGGIDPVALHECPGQIIMLATLKQAIEQEFQYFDFLRGDESYKAHWRAVARPMVTIRIVPDRLAARLRHRVWAAAKGLREHLLGHSALRQLARSKE